MLPSDREHLNKCLLDLNKAIDAQIGQIAKDAEKQGVKATEMKYINGEYILPPLLLADAQVLNALTMLNLEGDT